MLDRGAWWCLTRCGFCHAAAISREQFGTNRRSPACLIGNAVQCGATKRFIARNRGLVSVGWDKLIVTCVCVCVCGNWFDTGPNKRCVLIISATAINHLSSIYLRLLFHCAHPRSYRPPRCFCRRRRRRRLVSVRACVRVYVQLSLTWPLLHPPRTSVFTSPTRPDTHAQCLHSIHNKTDPAPHARPIHTNTHTHIHARARNEGETENIPATAQCARISTQTRSVFPHLPWEILVLVRASVCVCGCAGVFVCVCIGMFVEYSATVECALHSIRTAAQGRKRCRLYSAGKRYHRDPSAVSQPCAVVEFARARLSECVCVFVCPRFAYERVFALAADGSFISSLRRFVRASIISPHVFC